MAQEIAAPQRQPRKGGITDLVSLVEERRLGGPAADAFVWEDSGCSPEAHDTRAGCYDTRPDEALDDPKEFGGIVGYEIIEKFPRYVGVECFIGGDEDGPDYEAQARTNLEAIESREIEGRVWLWAAAAASPGTAANLVGAIGLADEHADDNYVGLPVMLMSRNSADAAFAAGVLARQDGQLVTANGTPVVATGRAADDEVSVIGWPVLLASPMRSYTAPDKSTNEDMAFAERIYAFGVDCDYRYNVTVTAP